MSDDPAPGDDLPTDAPPAGAGRDPRLRPVAIIMGVGLAITVVAAVLVGALGGSGVAAAAVLLVLLAATCGVAALYAAGTALVDDHRGRRVGRARVVLAVVLVLASAAFLVMATGVGSGGEQAAGSDALDQPG